MNKSRPRATMSLGFTRSLIAWPAYREKIGVEFSQRCPPRLSWQVAEKPGWLQARYLESVDMLGSNPSHTKVGDADRCRQQRSYRQPSPTKYLGDPGSQRYPLIPFDVAPVLTSERRPCPKLTTPCRRHCPASSWRLIPATSEISDRRNSAWGADRRLFEADRLARHNDAGAPREHDERHAWRRLRWTDR
jgi:hypothetical protein